MENTIKKTVDFTVKVNDKKFVFRYNPIDITIEQAEPAIAIASFVSDIYYNQPENTNDLIKSKAHRWISEIMKYLLFEVSNGKQLPFNLNNIEQTADLIKKLPAKELKKMEECIVDFLLVMKMEGIASKLQRTKKNQVIPVLTKLLQNTVKQ